MSNLRDIIWYFLDKFPKSKSETLSNARVTKMVYLADWLMALRHQRQASDVKWYFDSYGPFVHNIRETVERNPELFELIETKNAFGAKKQIFAKLDSTYLPEIPMELKEVLDIVISDTKDLKWESFIKLVYSTFPVVRNDRFCELDLVKEAELYQLQEMIAQ